MYVPNLSYFSDLTSSPTSCYTEEDVLQKGTKSMVLKDKTRIEASNFVKSVAEGQGKLIHGHHYASNDSFLQGNFKNGCLEGLIKGYEFMPLDGITDDPSFDAPIINSIAYYKHGFPSGPAWRIIYSPDGIVIGYFYLEHALSRNSASNRDVDFT